MAQRTEPARSSSGAWYRQPVLWLGIVLTAASLAGAVLLIVLGARYADEPVPTAGGEVFKVPRARPAEAPKPTPESAPEAGRP